MNIRNTIIKHYKKFFDLHAKGIALTEDDHLDIDWAESLVKDCFIPVVSISLPSDEEIREPIQNAIYATGSYTTDQCTEFADGILTYLDEAGFKVVRQ